MTEQFRYGDPGGYGRTLRQRLAPTQPGVIDPDPALQSEQELIERVRRDPVIAKAINQRLHYVAACDWFLESPDPASRQLLPYFEALIRRLDRFAGARLNLARAVFEGTRWARMVGNTGQLELAGSGRPLRWWWCEQLVDIDKRRLRLDREDKPADTEPGETPPATPPGRWFWNLYDPLADTWRRVEHPEHYVRHACSLDEGSLGYGRGLLESIYFYWRAKTTLFSYMCEGAERFAFPWIIARIGAAGSASLDASLGAPFLTADERADALVQALERMRRASVLVLDAEDNVETIDLSGEGNGLILDLVRYVDRCLVEVILGSSMPTGSGSAGGSLARARVERESTDDLLQFDREALEETLTRDFIGALWRYNRPAFTELGLQHLSPPLLRLGTRPRSRPDQAVDLIERCARIGVPLLASEVYKAIGFMPPATAPDILDWGRGGADKNEAGEVRT